MASEGKKILMFDETTGMLTKEVMLGYVHGELSPSVREDVEKFLANDEMHRDILEGLRQAPDKNQVESAIHAINERVAERTGAEVRTSSHKFEIPEYLSDYRKIAAVILGVLLLSGIIFTLLLLRESPPDIASVEKDTVQTIVIEDHAEPAPIKEKTTPIVTETTSGIIAQADEDTAIRNREGDQADAAAGAIASVEKKTESTNNNNKAITKEITAEKKPSVASDAGNTIAKDNKQTDSVASAMNYIAPATTGAANDAVITGNELTMAKTRESIIQESKEEAVNSKLALDEIPPVFPGGASALQQYIHNNLQYPKDAKESGIEGKVYVTFTIGTSGRVKDIRVVKGVSKDINAEAIRLVSNMPTWTPGKQKGKPESMKQYLTIEFSLSGNN